MDITLPTECETDHTLMNIAHRDTRNAERRGSFRPQPVGTVVYEVQTSDTLAGIAARCNITPSELVNLNKLSCRTIFPGQIIFIPDKTTLVDSPHVVDVKQVAPIAEQPSPKPGHVERVQSPVDHSQDNDSGQKKASPHTTPSALAEELDKESVEQFLKITVKYITDGEGVVSGVLLVTPNLVMFDPNVSDPLVIEHGTEKYGVVAPMHMVVRAGLYPDIMRMRIKDAPDSGVPTKMPDLYHSKKLLFGRSRTEEKLEPQSDWTQTATRRHSSVCEKSSSEDLNHNFKKNKFKEHSKSSEAVSDVTDEENTSDKKSSPSDSKSKEVVSSSLVENEHSSNPTEAQESVSIKFAQSKGLTSSVPSLDSGLEKHNTTVTHSQSFTAKKTSRKKSISEDEEQSCDTPVKDTKKKKYDFEKTKQRLQRGLRKLSITDGLLPAVSHTLTHRRMSLPSSPHSLSELKMKSTASTSHEKNEKKQTSSSGSSGKDSNGTSYINAVDEKPDLFLSFDKIIPRPAQSFGQSPLYLCLRMGKPIKKPLRHSTPVMHYGRKIKPEYWFSIPQARVDSLYLFFLRWTPEIYGDIDVANFEELGFLPIDHTDDEDEELAETSYSAERRKSSWAFLWKRRKSKDVSELTKPEDLSPVDWELISPGSEETSLEPEIVPELLSPSSILDEDQIKLLCVHLPARAIGYAWSLIYSTASHGFSLKTMYREMCSYDSPVLLVVCTTTGAVFGAMLSCPLRISDHFYGTGESFLFTFHPEFKCYSWAGENAYFIKGNAASFAIGASEGKFGLWLDDDLFHGRTQECTTYGNEPLCEEEDFIVKALEAWGFV